MQNGFHILSHYKLYECHTLGSGDSLNLIECESFFGVYGWLKNVKRSQISKKIKLKNS